MIKTLLTTLSLTCILSSCVTPYQDTRSQEVKNEQLQSAIDSLYGEYTIKDSRNNDGKFTSVTIHPLNGSIFAEFVNSNGGIFKVHGGAECSGGYRDSDKFARIFCNNKRPGEHISMIVMKRILSPEIISAGPGLFNYKAMPIESGYHLQYYLGNNGRPHHFSLQKK